MDASSLEDASGGRSGGVLMGRQVSRSQMEAFLSGDEHLSRDSEARFKRLSSIETATHDSIVFATEDESLQRALASGAGLILTTVELATACNCADHRILLVKDPKVVFARLFAEFFAARGEAEIHPTAVVGAGVSLGAGCRIDAGAVLGDGVIIGERCVIGPRVVIHAGSTLGAGVHVQSGAVLGSDGFGYVQYQGSYIGFPQIGTLFIEDDVEIGANTTIDRGALGETRIGRGTKIDNLVHIAHNCTIGANVMIAAQTGIAGSCVIEDGAMLGGQVGLGERVTVGAGVILGGQAGLLPGKTLRGKGEVFWGTPAEPVREFLRGVAQNRRGAVKRTKQTVSPSGEGS